MSATGADFRVRLEGALRALGMADDVAHAPRMLRYLEELQRWNKAYNLTAVRDPSQMLVQHVFDSLSVMPVLRAHAAGRALSVADVGSGAGLPGIIVGLCEPDWTVTCIDAVGKKTAFVRQAAGVLGLANVHTAHARVESLDPLQADIVISRAFASLADFARLAGRHVAPGGRLLAMKGQLPLDEQQILETTTPWRVRQVRTLHVPELDGQRCLLELGLKDLHD